MTEATIDDLKKYEELAQKALAAVKEQFRAADLAFAQECEKLAMPAVVAAYALVGVHKQIADTIFNQFFGGLEDELEADDEEE